MTLNSPINMRHSNCFMLTDPINLISDLISYLHKICFGTPSNTQKYNYNVIFLFHRFLIITVSNLDFLN